MGFFFRTTLNIIRRIGHLLVQVKHRLVLKTILHLNVAWIKADTRVPLMLCSTAEVLGCVVLLILLVRPGIASTVDTPSSANETLEASENTNPLCWDTDVGWPQPDPAHCLLAIDTLQADPQFRESILYSRQDNLGRKVPIVWYSFTCQIYLGLPNQKSQNTDTFSLLEAVFPQVLRIMVKCFHQRKPGHKFGGVVTVGNDQGFFVNVLYHDSSTPGPVIGNIQNTNQRLRNKRTPSLNEMVEETRETPSSIKPIETGESYRKGWMKVHHPPKTSYPQASLTPSPPS